MRARRGREADQRGSALVEAVIVFPIVLLITFGAIEFGIGFSQKGGIESLSRAGARTGATLAADASSPDSIGVESVKAINAALSSTALPEMKSVYVYRIESTGGSTFDWGPKNGCAQYCMKFDFNDATKEFKLVSSNGGEWPTSARNACGTNPDRIGVRIDADFNFLTGLIGDAPIGMEASTVLQLEPTADC